MVSETAEGQQLEEEQEDEEQDEEQEGEEQAEDGGQEEQHEQPDKHHEQEQDTRALEAAGHQEEQKIDVAEEPGLDFLELSFACSSLVQSSVLVNDVRRRMARNVRVTKMDLCGQPCRVSLGRSG